jgi:hypothetical protein
VKRIPNGHRLSYPPPKLTPEELKAVRDRFERVIMGIDSTNVVSLPVRFDDSTLRALSCPFGFCEEHQAGDQSMNGCRSIPVPDDVRSEILAMPGSPEVMRRLGLRR